jgi:molybdopterin converting factor small subunit
MSVQDIVPAVATTVRVLFFGRVGDVMGRERTVDLPPEGCTLGELRRRLAQAPGGEAVLANSVRASVDRTVRADDARVRPGAEVAFFSPFSGG